MKKKALVLIVCLVLIFSVSACGGKGDINMPKNLSGDLIRFKTDAVASDAFGGIGVEWDTYEYPSVVTDEKWELVIERLGKLNPSSVRCMGSYLTYIGNYDADSDSWIYDYSSASARNSLKILDYCQEKGITVAFGAWGRITNAEWNMEAITDERFSVIIGDVFNELVNVKGYDCIKYVIICNEPNYPPNQATQQEYKTAAQNILNEFEKHSLGGKVKISGPDVSGINVSNSWCPWVAENMPEMIGNYNIHSYINDSVISMGMLTSQYKSVVDNIKEKDSAFEEKKLSLWECGLLDGQDSTANASKRIETYDYGFLMTDLTMQAIMGGIHSMVYWDLDDVMHRNQFGNWVEWGMFASAGPADKQELRPWFHTSVLNTNIFAKGNKIYTLEKNYNANSDLMDKTFRALASVSKDGKQAGIVAVNQATTAKEKNFLLDAPVSGDKLYIYIFNQNDLRLDENSYLLPNYEIEGSLNKLLNINIPAKSAVFISNVKY